MSDLNELKQLLRQRGLGMQSDYISYLATAHLVGLSPSKKFDDAPDFHLKPARIPTYLFKSILADFRVMFNQYGPSQADQNLHVKSRFIAPLFNRIVSQFCFMIQANIGESYMEYNPIIIDLESTRLQLIYHEFRVCGGVTVLLIEFGMELKEPEDRLQSIAQLIADGYRYDSSNSKKIFVSPIHCILSDGSSFRFFLFDGNTSPATLFRCILDGPGNIPDFELTMPSNETSTNLQFVTDLRKLCETLNAIFYRGFILGMYARQRLFPEEITDAQDDWRVSITHANAALLKAIVGVGYAELKDTRHRAEEEAQEAACELRLSINNVPFTYRVENSDFCDFDNLDGLLAEC